MGSTLDPSADQETGLTTKFGIDATRPLTKPREKFERAKIPLNKKIARVIDDARARIDETSYGKDMNMKKFDRDLGILLTRLNKDADRETKRKLNELKNRLIRLNEENVVKINHSVMELVCAKYLVLKGYDVDVERPLEGGLTCDLYGVKGYGTLIVEVETGFVPPEHALDPATYCKARIASKITRYGNHSDKFALGVPPYYILQIPPALTKPPRSRKSEELKEIKSRCDLYYKNPPVSLDEIRNVRLHAIYVIDVDEVAVEEIDPGTYIENRARLSYM